MASGMLGLCKCKRAVSATNRFIDLAMLMVRRLIAMHRKAGIFSGASHWRPATLTWGRAEAAILQREEARGLRRRPIAAGWEVSWMPCRRCR
ncbi:hypothetical protein NDU88_001198 [Pleurodeles waltl]|uniref:Uncharacterized protein n=1 Tax=Pleurodeles waltl TaxID=8319 RepID=A0AAV7U7R3_PLEWA|nr:hypothetical protein NDU88_001198 [Pleurodeles waltl]